MKSLAIFFTLVLFGLTSNVLAKDYTCSDPEKMVLEVPEWQSGSSQNPVRNYLNVSPDLLKQIKITTVYIHGNGAVECVYEGQGITQYRRTLNVGKNCRFKSGAEEVCFAENGDCSVTCD